MQSKKLKIKTITVSALFASILCILSPFVIPIGPIPLSLANFAVMLCAFSLSMPYALLSVTVYILLGLCGLPVFSSFSGGLQTLFGATGGFIWGYILLCVFCSFAKKSKKRAFKIIFCLIGLALCYLLGVLQYCVVLKTSFLSAVIICVLPFLFLDIIKCILAYLISKKILKIM